MAVLGGGEKEDGLKKEAVSGGRTTLAFLACEGGKRER